MKLKSKVLSAAVLAACFASIGAAQAADTITLTLTYLGSTTGVATSAANVAQNTGVGKAVTTLAGSVNVSILGTPDGIFNASGLTQTDLTTSTAQTQAGLKNYYGVYAQYSGAAGDSLYGVGFNVIMTGGLVPVSSTGVENLTTQKWLAYNPQDGATSATTWSNFGDLGTNQGDLVGVASFNTSAAQTALMGIGTSAADGTLASGLDGSGYDSTRGGTLLGVFAVAFPAAGIPVGTNGTITLQYGGLQNFGVFTSPTATTAVYNENGFTGSTVTIAGAVTTAVPEPASLGVLALGGLALMARRRKTA